MSILREALLLPKGVATMSGSEQEAVRGAIADFCDMLPFLYGELSDTDQRLALVDVVEAARAGTDLRRSLSVLLCRVSPEHHLKEDANPLTELLRHLGVPHRQIDRGPSGGVPRLPRTGPGHTALQIFECPAGRCARRWLRASGEPIPRCAIDNDWLRERA
jgi:hypothetical protein